LSFMTGRAQIFPETVREQALAGTLALLSFAIILARTMGGDVFSVVAGLAFILLCALALLRSGLREWVLLGAALILTALLMGSTDGRTTLAEALDLAAFFGAFIALLTVLKVAAQRSDAVLAVGRFITNQPPGRRFYTTATGGHILGVFLNFGAVSLLAPMIQRSAVDADGAPDPALERRQISALLRGFAWILLWAPTTLTQAVLLTLFTDVDTGQALVLGLSSAALMVVLGWAWDKFEWRGVRSGAVAPRVAPPWSAIVIVGGICLSLISATMGLRSAAGYSTALALMIVAPSITLIWFACQTDGSFGKRLSPFGPLLAAEAPALGRSAMALGLSGFIGRTLAEVVPIEGLGHLIETANMPGWFILAALPILISLGGQIAISPIMLVVFLGQVLGTIPSLPVSDTMIVYALSAGWALSMLTSPNATATLLISATTKIAPTQLTWAWNLRFACVAYGVFVALFILLA
jgi:hypothetical protein